MEAGYQVHLVNTAAVKQYEGLKHGDDRTDARWLAHLLRLGILPQGYIYPKEGRAVRDLLRKRGQLVQMRTTNLLSIQTLITRNTGSSLSANKVKKLQSEQVAELLPCEDTALAVNSNLSIMKALQEQIKILEKIIQQKAKLQAEYAALKTVPGIGIILALTIMLETGPIQRFAKVGNYASYCRCVGTTRLSNGKQKGKGNAKNGNRYLSWAFVEAANFAIRYNDSIKAYYQRKQAKTNRVVALKTVPSTSAIISSSPMMKDLSPMCRSKVTFRVRNMFATSRPERTVSENSFPYMRVAWAMPGCFVRPLSWWLICSSSKSHTALIRAWV